MESIGIRELRQHASQIIKAAESGAMYRVTNHGQDTGVTIGRHDAASASAPSPSAPSGATPAQVQASGIYDRQRPQAYQDVMLDLVERGRDQVGRVDFDR